MPFEGRADDATVDVLVPRRRLRGGGPVPDLLKLPPRRRKPPGRERREERAEELAWKHGFR